MGVAAATGSLRAELAPGKGRVCCDEGPKHAR